MIMTLTPRVKRNIKIRIKNDRKKQQDRKKSLEQQLVKTEHQCAFWALIEKEVDGDIFDIEERIQKLQEHKSKLINQKQIAPIELEKNRNRCIHLRSTISLENSAVPKINKIFKMKKRLAELEAELKANSSITSEQMDLIKKAFLGDANK